MRIASLATIAFPALFLFGSILPAQVPCVRTMDDFVKDWSQSKQFTIDVANAMPAEFYAFKPVRAEMSFAEQMVHIAVANVYRFHEISNLKPPFELNPKMATPDKAGIITMLQQSFDYVISVLPQITSEQLQRASNMPSFKGRPQPNGRDMMMNMFVHTAHHRAQCEVYLRLKNIVPPTYTF